MKKDDNCELLKKRIYDEYPNILERLAFRGVDIDDVADIASKVMIIAMRKHHQLRDHSKLVPWLRKIADNEARSYLKKKAKMWEREVSVVAAMENGEEIDIYDTLAAERTVEMIVCSVETRDMLMELLEDMSDKEHTIFKLHNIDGYKLSEIAKYLGIKESTVRSIHSRTCKKLRKHGDKILGKEEWL